MIERYTLPEMGAIWSLQNKFQKWLDVEVAVCEVHAEDGTIPAEALEQIKAKAAFTVERINEIEKTTDHDVIAFTTNLAENIGPASRFVHYGLTSSDVVDTANALLLREACDVLLPKLDALLDVLKRRAFEFKETPQIGRTHGIHAEPTSFGLVWALWYSETQRNRERLLKAKEQIAVGKISGAVGAFAHLAPDVEERVCERLGLKAADVSTQVIQRDRYAEYLCTLAIIASTLEKIALQVRHWQRTEVREAQEKFKVGQKGSSAMPHKRNPILSERICGMARTVRANSIVGLENVALWHERDISHSSAERIVLPDSSATLDYILAKTTSLLDTLVVYPENMLKNLDLTRGLVFSGQLMLALTHKGVTREDAYAWTQRNAMKVWDEGGEYAALVKEDADISSHLSVEEIARVFDLKHYLRNVDRVFERVFG
ncbi:MAG TPA: adenylosuccinate lyase [Pyrinomonadaceae bacterium]|nr:adenylosuccinate lyase [Chloracidobacterium sp.]MBP9936229.1 adenylosuccinate lyase [Pyrinomonadaceae bacterium]MBK9437064.1 adenylosuccinate lyase [Chloracidobacterium sp.]MBK9767835.1 adenylosuccinate lyase [Chloracidobacterium sp.]MBL0239737.1 adenylosuccinate lyase [Chloracidobacterium sp.]